MQARQSQLLREGAFYRRSAGKRALNHARSQRQAKLSRLLAMGRHLMNVERPARAWPFLHYASHLAGDPPDLLFELAMALMGAGHHEAAYRKLAQALEGAPYYKEAFFASLACLANLGEWRRAADVWLASEFRPESGEEKELIALICARSGVDAEASRQESAADRAAEGWSLCEWDAPGRRVLCWRETEQPPFSAAGAFRRASEAELAGLPRPEGFPVWMALCLFILELPGTFQEPALEIRVSDREGAPQAAGSPLWLGPVGPQSPAFPVLPEGGADGSGFIVIVPVCVSNAAQSKIALACLKSLLKSDAGAKGSPAEILVVDDGGLYPAFRRQLGKWEKAGRFRTLRHKESLGFAGAVNAALAMAWREKPGRDVILLNADTLVFGDWAQRLRAHLKKSGAATATPLSNAGGLGSIPLANRVNPMPSALEARNLDRLCAENGAGAAPVFLPTGNGFCMAVSAGALKAAGGFRGQLFAQAYGEEVDFCLHLAERGFRHVAAPDVYVLHQNGAFGGAGLGPLKARNQKILDGLYPAFRPDLERFSLNDPLFAVRRSLEIARLRQMAAGKKRRVLFVTHGLGGGVERAVQDRICSLEKKGGGFALLLRPTASGALLEVGHKNAAGFFSLYFPLPSEYLVLLALLEPLGWSRIELHSFVGHSPRILDLLQALQAGLSAKRPVFSLHVHDHALFCPQVSLFTREKGLCVSEGRGPDECAACIKAIPPFWLAGGGLADFRAWTHRLAETADQIVIPVRDGIKRFKRHFSKEVSAKLQCAALQKEPRGLKEAAFRENSLPAHADAPVRIGVMGGIGPWKGADLLREIARHAVRSGLPLHFALVGSSEFDEALISENVEVTGPYREKEGRDLLNLARLDAAFIPSLAPESWSYVLSELWEAGLPVAAFDLGAVGERIRKSPAGRGAGRAGLPADRLIPMETAGAEICRILLDLGRESRNKRVG